MPRKRFRLFPQLLDARRASLSAVDDELRFHIESRVDDLVACGMPAEQARVTALAQFGDVRRYRDDTLDIDRQRAREVRMREFLESVRFDVAYAARCLRRAPGFAATAVVTVMLGIGATAAVFSAVSGCCSARSRSRMWGALCTWESARQRARGAAAPRRTRTSTTGNT
jgi:hypothetical protein